MFEKLTNKTKKKKNNISNNNNKTKKNYDKVKIGIVKSHTQLSWKTWLICAT